MESIIKKLLREGLIGEERKNINDLKDLILFYEKGSRLMIYNPKTQKPMGYIAFGFSKKDNVHPIYGVYSVQGYGPLLYELAMTYVYPNGITLDDVSPTSDAAINVWKKFYDRNDIKKEPINRTEKTYKEIELINNCKGDYECLNHVKEVLFLHNLKFSYDLGKNNLDNMIQRGNDYLSQNPNIDISDLTTDL